MPRPKGSFKTTPSYCRHKASGQAYVTLAGQVVYLGDYGSRESKAKYERVIGEWLASGRVALPPSAAPARPADVPAGMTITELIDAFWTHAATHYTGADGQPGREQENFRCVLRHLKRLYGVTVAAEFGPLKLKALREEVIRSGWSRKYTNRQMGRLKHVFKFGVENELIPPAVHHALAAVEGIRKGRGGVRETEPVRPVPEERVYAVRPFVSRQVFAMAELQLTTGMRSGEVTRMRPVDVNTTDEPWVYSPPRHKTSHHDVERTVYLGRKAREILAPFLAGRAFESFLFSPAEAEAERREKLRAARKTPLSCGNRAGTNRRRKPKRTPGPRYTVNAYLQAIYKACDKAFPPPEYLGKRKGETAAQWRQRLNPEQRQELREWRDAHRWHPHQLRHVFARRTRRQHGIEVARILLGHTSPAMTALYAEADRQKAVRAVADVG